VTEVIEGQVVDQAIEIPKMDVKDARSLLVARGSFGKLSGEEEAIMQDIITDQGCLTLMLEQVAAFVRATGVSLSKYRSHVKNKGAETYKYCEGADSWGLDATTTEKVISLGGDLGQVEACTQKYFGLAPKLSVNRSGGRWDS
jgi:hypothetical protein